MRARHEFERIKVGDEANSGTRRFSTHSMVQDLLIGSFQTRKARPAVICTCAAMDEVPTLPASAWQVDLQAGYSCAEQRHESIGFVKNVQLSARLQTVKRL